jgi:ABC-2 type transport system ATP-binding protein
MARVTAKRTERRRAAVSARERGALSAYRPGEEPVIHTRGLTKRYGSLTAVDRLDLDIYEGEIYGLLGPNGAGKTTTVLMLLGLSEPTAGQATVLGLDPTRDPLEVKRRVGYLPDSVGFYDDMTGRQNLRYTAYLNGMNRTEADERIDDLLGQVRLTDVADRNAGTYSRGMLQRLGIADALVKSPSVLILDEPTISIDPIGVAELLDLIRGLVKERGLTVLLSSHLLEQVQHICDRVGIFCAGRLMASGTVAELLGASVSGIVTVEVGVEGDVAVAAGAVRGVAGVDSVKHDPEQPGVLVVTGTRDLRNEVVAVLARNGLPITHLLLRRAGLEEVYRRSIQECQDRLASVERLATAKGLGA